MSVLVIDNYDSFTYNLVQYVRELTDDEVTVKRNDQLTLEEVQNFDRVLISPGPGLPEEAGLTKKIIERYGTTKSILGVCLGMQAIAEVYGGKLTNLSTVFHGVSTPLAIVEKDALMASVPDLSEVGRYHSWAVDAKSIPSQLEVLAISADRCVMAIRHRELNVRGVQFHPESVLTPYGKTMIENWLKIPIKTETKINNKELVK